MQVLFGVSLTVGEGEVVTTARTLMGLISACGGSATFDGEKLTMLPPSRVAQRGRGGTP